ncbi:hypothetical protein [Haliea sp.]|jgi:integrating conjugative element protein (TIGR03759 family)|uniref:hypothetical protein n=1 Tax=Haliea sp. TaxID=1932666 RepID=UPI000C5EA426|nr:hypothetical protein [Haliea sp.]MAD65688.1 hypothetical protein [Haliea sp.]|tara:strand:+ start:22388 stop:23101 length:714 start_codon:yes stop_codon:yes gene_type:complete
MQKARLIATLIISGVFSHSLLAQEPQVKTENIEQPSTYEEQVVSEKAFKETWNLSKEDYDKYLKALEGPFGYYTPKLERNPIMALGVTAETMSDRMKYARKHVDVEFEKNKQVIAWQLAVSLAWQEKFPNTPRFANQEKDKYKRISLMEGFDNGERVRLYIKMDCRECDKAFEKLYRRLQRGGGGIDVYFVDEPKPSVEEISRWAMSQGLTETEVKRKDVTLNYGDQSISAVPVISN